MNRIKDLYDLFEREIRSLLKDYPIENIDFDTIIPNNHSHGDLSTNAALKLSSSVDKTPQEIGNIIITSLDRSRLGIKDISLVNPGFINIFLNDSWVRKIGDMIITNGLNIITKGNEPIVLETPTIKEGNKDLRLSSYLDLLENILEFRGNQVIREEKDNIAIGDMFLTKKAIRIYEDLEEILDSSQINLWSISKTYKVDVEIPLETVHLNTTSNPLFYVNYPYNRAKNILGILEKEGHSLLDLSESLQLNHSEGKDLIFKILEIDNILKEVTKFKEPFKLYSYFYDYCTTFYSYNNNLLFREMTHREILENMYILKVVEAFTKDMLLLLKLA